MLIHKLFGSMTSTTAWPATMVVPGSALVKAQAEEEGLDRVFEEAGFEWRGAGYYMARVYDPDTRELAAEELIYAMETR